MSTRNTLILNQLNQQNQLLKSIFLNLFSTKHIQPKQLNKSFKFISNRKFAPNTNGILQHRQQSDATILHKQVGQQQQIQQQSPNQEFGRKLTFHIRPQAIEYLELQRSWERSRQHRRSPSNHRRMEECNPQSMQRQHIQSGILSDLQPQNTFRKTQDYRYFPQLQIPVGNISTQSRHLYSMKNVLNEQVQR
eukprot:TRINITY_DN5374_c0_g1_i8.p2 TRINITY_DN5374_c0_g1~~TRINITY_DN5374_c0_g1_i8.p2  ORF type:complete len:206 (-),score=-14.74 TRINITY_DN5374_c0_g1_i8:42-617(-)